MRREGYGPAATENRDCPHGSDGPAPGVVTGRHDEAALSIGIPLGRFTPAQWRSLTETARHGGRGELRLTPWRGVVVPGVERRRAAGLLDSLGTTGLVVGPDSPWTGVGACIGRPGCAKSLADVRGRAAAAVGPVGLLPVYWSGCERRCGHPRGEWVDVVATPSGGHRICVVRGEERDAPVSVHDSPGGLAAAVAAARGTRG